MAKIVKNIEKNMFKLFVKQAEEYYDSHVQELKNYIIKQQALGVPKQQILERLKEDYKNGVGFYERTGGILSKELNNSLNTIFQTTSNDYEGVGLYEWVLDPAAEHCDSCLHQAGRGALPVNEFPIPGNQETHGETNCNEYCKCTLVRKK